MSSNFLIFISLHKFSFNIDAISSYFSSLLFGLIFGITFGVNKYDLILKFFIIKKNYKNYLKLF